MRDETEVPSPCVSICVIDEPTGLCAGCCATLDVFRDEPLPPKHRFWHHPRVTLTPHVSAVTLVEESVAQIAAKIRCLEAGRPITGVVGREYGY
ncbi:MAG: DUF1289 domain-containing protein [Betaproteobacteria bacterium]|nr:MAG: DUF1289 domain-containing protein [Betaproteobacteria bacterium]